MSGRTTFPSGADAVLMDEPREGKKALAHPTSWAIRTGATTVDCSMNASGPVARVLRFADAATSAVVSSNAIFKPPGCSKVYLRLRFFRQGAEAQGDVVLLAGLGHPGAGGKVSNNNGGNIAPAEGTLTLAVPAQDAISSEITWTFNVAALSDGAAMYVEYRRAGANAADTFAGAIDVYYALLEWE